MKHLICLPHIAIEGVLTRQKCAENGAPLYGPWVSNFLSHRIVKSLTFRIYGKLKFQCTRNGTQNHPFCPGSPQTTSIIVKALRPVPPIRSLGLVGLKPQATSQKLSSHASKTAIFEMFANGKQTNK